jgi:hypothetical protein
MNEACGRLEVAVQHKGVEVRSIGPHDGSQVLVHANPREKGGVGEWLKDRAAQLSREIDVSRAAIAEADPQSIVTEHLCGRHRYEVHPLILREGGDRLRGAATRCADPVCFELGAVQIGPLRDEFERASRQITDEHLAVPDRYHRVVLGVLGMEVGRFVIVEVHRDRDAAKKLILGTSPS